MADNDKTGKDKVYHMMVCLVAAVIHPWLAVGLAIGKEYGDAHATGNHWCWWDLLADSIGIAIGGTLHYLILHWIIQ